MDHSKIIIIEEYPPGVTRKMMSGYVSRVLIKGLYTPYLKERFGKDAYEAFEMSKQIASKMRGK